MENNLHAQSLLMELGRFSIDQLKGKQLPLMFQPDALVVHVFGATLAPKTTRTSGETSAKAVFL